MKKSILLLTLKYAGFLSLLLAACATPPAGETTEADVLERWLYRETEAAPGEAVLEEIPVSRISLESLAPRDDAAATPDSAVPSRFSSFTLAEPGRVAVEVQSEAGAEVVLIDRSSGVLARAGHTGIDDGRIDILLDAGEYRVEVRTLREEETAALSVKEFSPRPVDPALLSGSEPGALHAEVLEDYQSVSFWVTLGEGEPLILEALGRCLHDLVIWKDGILRLPESFGIEDYAPSSGRSMGYVEVNLTPGAGDYLVTLYGGAPRVWEDGSEETPLYVRRGYRDLGTAVDAFTVISPMGRDAFLVSGEATVFEVENPDFETVTLGVSRPGSSGRFSTRTQTTLTKESETTRKRLSLSTERDTRLLFVQGTPGDEVRLRALPSREQYYIENPPPDTRYLISSLSSLDSDHSLDATAVILRSGEGGEGGETVSRLAGSSHVTVTPEEPLHRVINASGEISFVVDITEPGDWAMLYGEDNPGGDAAFIPLREVDTAGLAPPVRGNPSVFTLQAGIHLFIMRPDRPGILEFVLYHSSARNPRGDEERARELMGSPAPAPRRDFTFITERNEITAGSEHLVVLNQRSGPLHSLFVEPLPLDLSKPVPLTLEPGQKLSLPVQIPARGRLTTGYAALELQRQGKKWDARTVLDPGMTEMTILNRSGNPVTTVLRFEPVTERAYILPEKTSLAGLYPRLVPGSPVYFDLLRGETRHFLLQVEQAGFYELQTTGRLSTKITVRTAVNPSGPREEGNGPGRNALVQGFFRPGLYLVAVETTGLSQGRAGLVMKPLVLENLGRVRENTWYRKALEAGTGLTGTVALKEPGRYNFTSFGLYGSVPVRVEDAEGWPVLEDRFYPGLFRFYSWPRDVSHRRLTGIFPVPGEEVLLPEEPWPLALNGSRTREWRETPGRKPQEFLVNAPAAVPVQLSLDSSLTWTVMDEENTVLREGSGGASFELPRGENRILVKNGEVGDRVSYTLSVSTGTLADGLSQMVFSLPAAFPVILDEPGVCELWSFGSRDVRARLVSEDGSVELARGDDREGDWNFFLSRHLPAGRYRLVVEDAFSGSGGVTVHCRVRSEVRTEERFLPLEADLSLDREIVGIPFLTGPDGGMTLIQAGSPSVELSLYRGSSLLAEGTGTIAVPLEGAESYLLRLRNAAPEPVETSLFLEHPETATLAWDGFSPLELPRGSSLVEGEDLPSVLTGSPGVFLSGTREAPARSLPGEALPVPGRAVWCWIPEDQQGGAVLNPLAIRAREGATFLLGDKVMEAVVEGDPEMVYILEASAMTGRIGMDLSSSGKTGVPLGWTSSDVREGHSVIGFTGIPTGRLRFWDGESLPQGRRVKVRLTAYPLDAQLSLEEGQNLTLAAGKAVKIDTAGEEYLSLLLSPGVVAFTGATGSSHATAAAGDGNRTVHFAAGGKNIYLVNTGVRDGFARVGAAPPPAVHVLEAGGVLEFPPERTETLVFRLEPGGDIPREVLLWSETSAEVVLYTPSGRRVTARRDEQNRYRLPLVEGFVEVTAAPGPVAVWTVEMGEAEAVPSWVLQAGGGADLAPGQNPLPDRAVRRRFSLGSEKFVIFSTPSRGITALVPGGDTAAPMVSFGTGPDRDVYALLPAGDHDLVTRPLGGEPQRFPLSYLALDPVEVTESVPGEPLFLAPGEKAVFRIEVAEKVPVGVGLEAESDLYSAVLLGPDLAVLGRGRYFYRTLEPGPVYLLVENGPVPMRVRPVTAGNTGSRRGVPESVIESFRGE